VNAFICQVQFPPVVHYGFAANADAFTPISAVNLSAAFGELAREELRFA
jgi:hypothetical protein